MEQNSSSSSKRYSEEDARDSAKIAKTDKIKTEREEMHFYELFKEILNYVKDRDDICEEDISHGISSIMESFKRNLGKEFSDINLAETDKLCGYLFRYAPHGAGLVRNRALDAFNNFTIFKETLKQPELNLLSLGGGPGNDIVGFCSALYEYHCHSSLNITVVDSVQRWSSCLNLAEFFIREDDFGNVSKLFRQNPVTVSFIKVKLPGKPYLDRKYLRILKEADIIVMSKLLSIMEWNEKTALIESLYADVKPEAFLLFIDSPFKSELWAKFDILYSSDDGDYMVSDAVSTLTRFDHSVAENSRAQITILRKKACQK